MIVANIFDPATGAVSAMNATHWSDSKRETYVSTAHGLGFTVTFTKK